MPRRLLIVLIIFAALVIFAVALLIVVDRSPSLKNAVYRISNQTDKNAAIVPIGNANTNAAVTDPQAADRAAVTYVARNFAEIYGSGNNENDFANLTDAQTWGTDNFNGYLQRTIAQSRLTLDTSTYQGTVTKALVINVANLAAGTAKVTVGTQRVDTIGVNERTYNQEIYIDLVKQGDLWKVNAAAWQVL